jgi:diguanylate cyclase (GGDEF)-like protein
VQLATLQQQVVSVGDADGAVPPSEQMREAMRSARIETVAIVPVTDHLKPLGAVVMSFRRARTFEAEDVDLAETLARQAAEVLARLRAERVLERLALHDELTGLPARRLIRARVNEAIDQAQTTKRPAAVVMIDLAGFTAIGETFGHVVRDDALIEVGGRLSAAARDGDLVGRFGDDEFVIVCPDADTAIVEDLVQRLLADLRQPLRAGGGEATVTSSIGAAVYSGLSKARPSWQRLLEGADQAVYRSRNTDADRAAIVTIDEAPAD